jgi:hypothetical protein
MAVEPLLALPYGLSDLPRQIHTVGKMPARPVGPCARWQIPTLQTLAATSISRHTLGRRHNLGPPHKRSSSSMKHKLIVSRKDNMAVTSASALSRRKQAKATPKPKRKRTSIVDLPARSHIAKRSKVSTQNPGRSKQKAKRKMPIGPGTQIGDSREVPIVISDEIGEDSDFEMDVRQHSNLLRNSSPAFSSTPSSRGIYSSLSSIPVPTQHHAHTAPSAYTIRTREPSIYVG